MGQRAMAGRGYYTDIESGTPDVKLGEYTERHLRIGFIRKVYGILCVQLILTASVSAYLLADSHASEYLRTQGTWVLYLAMAASFVLVLVISCFDRPRRTFPTNYILLFLFTACESVLLGFATSYYTTSSVLICLGITTVVVVALTFYACTTKTDFTGWGPYLFAALIVVIVFCIVLSF